MFTSHDKEVNSSCITVFSSSFSFRSAATVFTIQLIESISTFVTWPDEIERRNMTTYHLCKSQLDIDILTSPSSREDIKYHHFITFNFECHLSKRKTTADFEPNVLYVHTSVWRSCFSDGTRILRRKSKLAKYIHGQEWEMESWFIAFSRTKLQAHKKYSSLVNAMADHLLQSMNPLNGSISNRNLNFRLKYMLIIIRCVEKALLFARTTLCFRHLNKPKYYGKTLNQFFNYVKWLWKKAKTSKTENICECVNWLDGYFWIAHCCCFFRS